MPLLLKEFAINVVAAGNSDFLGLTNRLINIHLVTGHEHHSKENYQFLL